MGATAKKEKWRDCYRTPPEIITCVNKLYGKKSWYDPCPYDYKFNGLIIPWGPKNYINPPFSQYLTWVKCGIEQVGEQIWFSNSNTETQYYQLLLKFTNALILPSHRIAAISPITNELDDNPRQGQSLFYAGYRPFEFMDRFGHLGFSILLKQP